MSKVLFVIPPERFRDEELFITKAELENSGHNVIIASTMQRVCPGSRGGTIHADITLSEVNSKDYKAVVFIGGGGSKLLWKNEFAHKIAKEMNNERKVVAAICLAPVTLAYSGILNGENATVAGTEAKTIETMGAHYTGPGVTVDGNIVTANAPKASKLFAEQILRLLKN